MIGKKFLQISDSFARFFEGGIQEKEIMLFCTSEFKRITTVNNKPSCVIKDLDEIGELLNNLGWLKSERKTSYPEIPAKPVIEPAEIIKWTAFFEAHHVIEKGIIAAWGSFYLNIIDQMHGKNDVAFVKNNLEKLIRHVEVMREKSLSNYSDSLTHDQVWLERYDTSILFSRFARRHSDLRFLNAAYKLNDWFFEKKEGRKTLECQSRFVLALCEQEFSSMELLK